MNQPLIGESDAQVVAKVDALEREMQHREQLSQTALQILEDVQVCFGGPAGQRLLAFLEKSYCEPLNHESLMGLSGEDLKVRMAEHAARGQVISCIRNALAGKIGVAP